VRGCDLALRRTEARPLKRLIVSMDRSIILPTMPLAVNLGVRRAHVGRHLFPPLIHTANSIEQARRDRCSIRHKCLGSSESHPGLFALHAKQTFRRRRQHFQHGSLARHAVCKHLRGLRNGQPAASPRHTTRSWPNSTSKYAVSRPGRFDPTSRAKMTGFITPGISRTTTQPWCAGTKKHFKRGTKTSLVIRSSGPKPSSRFSQARISP
jgi:hypothetical protein